MAEIHEIPNETIRDQWAAIMLTNRRVIGPGRDGGTIFLVLERVDWAGIRGTHHPWLILIAIASFMMAPVTWDVVGPGLLVIGLIVLLAYWVSRSTAISIGAGSGMIQHRLPRGGYDAAIAFCRKIVAEAHGARVVANGG